MKKYIVKVMCVCLCAGFAMAGCKKDSEPDPEPNVVADNMIVGTVFNRADADIDAVKGLINHEVVTTSNYFDNKFTLSLPPIIDDYLFLLDDETPGMKLSIPKVKVATLDIFGYKDAKKQNIFRYCMQNADNSVTEGLYVYAESDVIITGSRTDNDYRETYNIALKKGWNIMYATTTESGKTEICAYTTKARSGMVWIYTDSEEKSFQQQSVVGVAGSQKRLLNSLKSFKF